MPIKKTTKTSEDAPRPASKSSTPKSTAPKNNEINKDTVANVSSEGGKPSSSRNASQSRNGVGGYGYSGETVVLKVF